MHTIKIGILIDEDKLPRYQTEILSELEKAPWCEIALFVKKQKNYDPYARDSRYALYRTLRKLDEKLFGRSTPYLSLSSAKSYMKQSEVMEIRTDESDYFDVVHRDDREKIRAKGIDVFLNFGFKIIKDDFIKAAKYGIWEFRHPNRPAGFWEVVENIPASKITLERIGSALTPGFVLDSFTTVSNQKSMRKNYESLMWRSHMMMVRNLERLAKSGDGYFEDKAVKCYFYDMTPVSKSSGKKWIDLQFGFSDDSGKSAPSNCQALKAGCKLLGKYAKFTARRFFEMDRWIILFSENKNGEINPDLSTYQRLPLPSNEYFQADPFMVDEGDKTYLFYEELDYKTLKGYLLVSEYDEKSKTFVNPQEVLKKEYHLSYPNVFKHEEKYYMIPETNENKTIDLYEAELFPTKWKKIRTMLSDVTAVDATLYHREDTWWMFVSIAEKEGFSLNDSLYLYHCKDFRTDEWKPHAMNPVISDVTSARPAGNLIEKEGRLFRPAQNCGGVYGRGMVINEVLALSTEHYEERVAQEIRADFADDLLAVHTLNSSRRFSVIDAIKSR